MQGHVYFLLQIRIGGALGNEVFDGGPALIQKFLENSENALTFRGFMGDPDQAPVTTLSQEDHQGHLCGNHQGNEGQPFFAFKEDHGIFLVEVLKGRRIAFRGQVIDIEGFGGVQKVGFITAEQGRMVALNFGPNLTGHNGLLCVRREQVYLVGG